MGCSLKYTGQANAAVNRSNTNPVSVLASDILYVIKSTSDNMRVKIYGNMSWHSCGGYKL